MRVTQNNFKRKTAFLSCCNLLNPFECNTCGCPKVLMQIRCLLDVTLLCVWYANIGMTKDNPLWSWCCSSFFYQSGQNCLYLPNTKVIYLSWIIHNGPISGLNQQDVHSTHRNTHTHARAHTSQCPTFKLSPHHHTVISTNWWILLPLPKGSQQISICW